MPKTGARSARARGLRTLQHQTLPRRTCYGIDTELWFRGLVAGHEARNGGAVRVPTKDEVHDEAIRLFLERYAQRTPEQYPARRTSDQDVTFWVDSGLVGRVREMAARDGVRPARLIDAALSSYVEMRVPDELLQFRQRIEEQAATLHQRVVQPRLRRRPRPPPAGRPARKPGQSGPG